MSVAAVVASAGVRSDHGMRLRRPFSPLFLVLVSVLAAGIGRPGTGLAGVLAPWDVGNVSQTGQLTVYNRTEGGSYYGYPLAAGDMNGDGRADLILTPMAADSGPARNRIASGEAVIVLSAGTIAGERDLATLDVGALPSDVTVVYGADQFDYLGTQVDAADLDRDGFADAIIAAQYGDGPDNQCSECGEVVIVWGGPNIGGQIIDLRSPPAGATTLVFGAGAGERLGAWVSSGDVDGDGIADAILGADQASPGGRRHAGITYVLYGTADLRSRATVDLADPGLPLTAIAGIDPEDHSGATVRATDINRDGAADVLIGAGLNRLSAQIGPTGGFNGHGSGGGDGRNDDLPCGQGCEVGEAYVVYGQLGERPASIDLTAPPPSTTFIYGIDPGDAYGEELFAGDFNGDGWGDVAVGAITADGLSNARPGAGEIALVYGGPELEGSVIELASPPSSVTFFFGRRQGAIAGDTALFLDVDGDARDDLVIACPNDHPEGRVQAGTNFVIFGTNEPLPQSVELSAIPSSISHLVINGAEGDDMLAYSMGHGDVNGDGLDDMLLNAMRADAFDNLLDDAGEMYVLDSVAVTLAAGREPVPTRTPTATVVVSPSATPTPTLSEGQTPTVTATQPTPSVCAGDCDGGGSVTINELILAVNIALEAQAPTACPAVDTDSSGSVGISELIAAVTRSLSGC